MICSHCKKEISESKSIVVDGYEYDVETIQLGKSFDDIIIPEGYELWTHEDCIKLHSNKELRKKLNLVDCWFWIVQPFVFSKDKDYVTWFNTSFHRANITCNVDQSYLSVHLGVRFKRKVEQ
jgi:hypothetical protein